MASMGLWVTSAMARLCNKIVARLDERGLLWYNWLTVEPFPDRGERPRYLDRSGIVVEAALPADHD